MRGPTELRRFVEKHLTKVEGWAGSGESLLLLETLFGVQQDCDDGGALEIGVHHGRYLIALHNACDPGTRSLGIDLFGNQARNVDRSGSGDMRKARENVDSYCREPDLVELMTADSLTLGDEDLRTIADAYPPFRISSVDGGHTPTHAAADIRTAARLSSSSGLISVDDFFHTNFPGVTEGVYAVLANSDTPFVPWIVTRKKLFLAHISVVGRYTSDIKPRLKSAGHRPKTVSIAGHECLSVYI